MSKEDATRVGKLADRVWEYGKDDRLDFDAKRDLKRIADELHALRSEFEARDRLPKNESPLAVGLRELLAQWDRGDIPRGEFEAKVDCLVRPEDDALKIRIGSNVPADQRHPLADSVREVLTQWIRGELYRDAFEAKMRDVICHFAKAYIPVDADLEKLKLVGKLAYQFKFRMQSVFIGGTKIDPFWDAIAELPTNLLNEAHAEMKAEIDEMKKP